ncbi:MAG TPA: putative Ig domain-containing protein [Opitutaceae bacterium]|nr:putative Ig domain-containing protein [Opitutaceae bacterium]
MRTPFCRWSFIALLLLSALCGRAQLVAPPTFTSIGVPATAYLNQSVTISATAQGTYSDNSDGNNWNTAGQLAIMRIIINVTAPDTSTWNINDWMPGYVTPNSASVPLTLDQNGTWYIAFYAMDGRPWWNGVGPYSITVSTPPPGPVITSSLGLSVNQGQNVSYQITAINTPTSFAASSLPAGLSINTSTGVISGRITASSNVSSTIQATNAFGTDTKTLNWTVTAASIAPTGSASPAIINLGQSVALTRNGTANFGVAYTENTVWRPNGSTYSLGTLGLGSSNYTPDGGTGLYSYRFRLVDSLGNYSDQWIAIYVAEINPLTVTVSPGGQVYDARTATPVISFGQSVTVNATATDVGGQMIGTQISGDFGITGNWAGYGGTASFSPTSTYAFSATYQPSARGTGSHWMAAFGNSAGYGWWGRGFGLTVNKATPTGTFANRSLAPNSSGYYAVASGDLNATFVNPYSGAVAAPTGSVPYRFTSTSTNVTAGTQLASGTGYSIDALYPGDANYNALTKTAAFTILGPTLPSSFQPGTTGSTFVTLSWAASTSSAGINHYEVYRNGVLIGSPTTTAFTDSTASASTGYAYTVKAVDNSSYVSAVASLSVTTAVSFELFTPTP